MIERQVRAAPALVATVIVAVGCGDETTAAVEPPVATEVRPRL
jgi:hypothetical protein